MKKLKSRAILCLFLAGILLAGLIFYVVKLSLYGNQWASYPANQHIYTDGYLSTGSLYDRNGTLLLQNNKGEAPTYNQDLRIRKATLHTVGDQQRNISSGANNAFASDLVGYNFVSGVYTTNNAGRSIYLTIDAKICRAANEALAGRNGTVGVYNYKTGEIICMVSSPNYDPLNPPTADDSSSSGMYLNKFLSSKVVPGSIFKTVTAMGALESVENLDQWTYTCNGSLSLGDSNVDQVTCPYAHGTVDLEGALAQSCNCAFAKLSLDMGKDNLEKYTKKSGLMNSYSIDGINTLKSSFEFSDVPINLAWTGIGQSKDLVNPCAMMVYMGAIANEGEAANPRIMKKITFTNGFPASLPLKKSSSTLLSSTTASQLDKMMHNDVVVTYGEENFPGLDLCAKSGTAEISPGEPPHAWFSGYIRNEGYPYAFIVLVENGGTGNDIAGSVTNQVLQEVMDLPASEE